jgi:thiol-disulfide isomerase/thioredoxin
MKFAVGFLLAFSLSAFAQIPSARRAPGFSLMDVLTLKQHDMQDYRGKVVLVDFMRTDCPHCQDLTRTLEQVKAKYGDKIQILSIVNPPDDQTRVRKYVADFKLTNPVLFDCSQVAISYLQIGPKNPTVDVPYLFVIDKGGIIRKELSEKTGGGLALTNITAAIDPFVK